MFLSLINYSCATTSAVRLPDCIFIVKLRLNRGGKCSENKADDRKQHSISTCQLWSLDWGELFCLWCERILVDAAIFSHYLPVFLCQADSVHLLLHPSLKRGLSALTVAFLSCQKVRPSGEEKRGRKESFSIQWLGVTDRSLEGDSATESQHIPVTHSS